jgi:hypothetical protein
MKNVAVILSKAKPDFLIVDDDFRMVLAGMGCYCDAHLQRFAKLSGKKYSREELQKIFDQTDPESKKLGDLYIKMTMDSLMEVAAAIREGIDSVNPDLECGYCTSSEGGEFEYSADMAKILAGKNTPFVRLNNGFYMEDGALSFPYRQMNTAIETYYIKDKVDQVISEGDTYPQNRYSLSLTGLDMHITSSLMTGCTGVKMWIENHRFHDEKINRLYLDFVKKNWKKWREIYHMTRRYRWLGAVTPLPAKAPTFLNPAKTAKQIRTGDFMADCFGVLGIAGSYGDDGSSLVALTGDQMKFFSDNEIRELLRRKMIIDITAVRELVKRGFGEDIGVKEVLDAPQNSFEVITDPELKAKKIPDVLSVLRPVCGQIVPMNGARVLSQYARLPFANGPSHLTTPVAPASVICKNSKGGTILSLPLPMSRDVWSRNVNLHHIDRKPYFVSMLSLLDEKRAPVYVDTDLSCYLMYKIRWQDNSFFAAVYNLSLDHMEQISLHCGKEVKSVKVLENNGKWKSVVFKQKAGTITFDNPGNGRPVIFTGQY